MPESASKCPMFQNGCPYSSSLEENSAFRHYLTQCKSFKEEGCPFKDLISVEHIKSVIAAKQFSEEYSKEVLIAHLEPSKMDMAKAREVCPAFKDGCIFAKKSDLKIATCPVWKNGCPFKLLVSEGGISLVEAFQSNSWHLLLSAVDKDQDESHDSEEAKSESFPIASMLKEGTQESHALAESVQFVKRFRKKEITRELYQLLIRNLYFVYANMERLVDQWSERNKNIKSLNFEQLKREATLEKDLQFFYGPEWRSIIMPHSQDNQDLQNMSPATANYVKRLMQIAEDPELGGELLISHAYTRYLGDLSGGQLLKRMARRSMNLPTAPRNATVQEISRLPIEQVEGTEFYDFLQIPDANSFKNMYRQTLDSLSVTSEIAQQMVVEANVAFRLNMELFQELDEIAGFTDPDAPKELPKTLPSSHPEIPAKDPAAPAAQCPFSTMFSSKPKTSAPKLAPEQTTEQILRPHPAASSHKQLYYVAFLLTILIAAFAVLFARVQ